MQMGRKQPKLRYNCRLLIVNTYYQSMLVKIFKGSRGPVSLINTQWKGIIFDQIIALTGKWIPYTKRNINMINIMGGLA